MSVSDREMVEDVVNAAEVGGDRGGINLSDWEEEFVQSVKERVIGAGRELTDKQRESLKRIWDRI